MSDAALTAPVTAAMIAIGDEVLSGRTKDKNIGAVADFCTGLGIELREARVIGDDMDAIVTTVRELSARFTYVFTTGGIGPTHDDITADAMARAFGVALTINEDARSLLEERAALRGFEMNEGMLRMARVPEGAEPIPNRISAAPGFRIGNVYVMAGVPKIMQAMLDEIAKTIVGGRRIVSRELLCGVGESVISEGLEAVQRAHPLVKIGSYPQMIGAPREGVHPIYAYIVLRTADSALLEAALADVQRLLDDLHAERGISFSEEQSA